MTLQFRRGTDSDRLTITPAIGEPIYTTDTKQLYVGDGSTAGGTLVSGAVDSASTQAIIDSNIGAIGADLLPAVDSTYDLGSASKKWKDLHLSGNSIFLGGHKIIKDGDTIKFTDSAGTTINIAAGNVATTLIDSSDVTAIITAGGYTTYDSTNASGQITTAINNLIDAAPASLDTLNELAAALNDDANFAATVTASIAALPDSAQVATIVTSYGYTTYDSSNTTGLIDSAYINARTDANLDSALTIALIDSAYVQARQTAQDFAYSSLTGAPNVLDSADVALIAQANDTTRDSAFVTGIVDSAYIAARVAAGTDSATVSSIVTTTVDSAYVQLRQATVSSGATTITTFNYEADSGQTTFTGADIDGSTLTYTSGKLNVYLNGILLVDSNDYTATNGSSIVLNTGADSADIISVISYISQAVGTLDSVGVTNLIDSAYIQARQVDLQRDSAFITNIVDSAYINARVSATDSATVSAIITADVDAAFINALTIGADSLGGQAPSYYLDYNNFTNTPTIPTAVSDLSNDTGFTTFDSTNAINLIDSAYIAARTTTGTDSATVSTIVTTTVDSAYVQARQSTVSSGATTISTFNYEADSGQTTFSGADIDGASLTYTSGKLNVYLNGILLVDSNDYTATNGTSIVLNTAADSSDIVSVISYITQAVGTLDSVGVTNLIDSAYINARASSYDSDNFTGQLAAASTSDLSEGTNLYYTTARHDSDFDARLTAGTGVTVSSGQVSIGQSVGTTDSVEFGNIDVSGNVIVGGNLQVTGTTTTVNSENLNVTDNMIYLNAGESAGSPTAAIDVGWAANINDDGSYTHVGMFRDATDNTFKVFGNYTPEPDSSVEINTGHASFTLAPFAASTLTGQYQGFDSDVTAAGLATQTYVDNAVAALPDSTQVATIVTSYGYSTFDSTNATGLITSYGYTTYDSTNTLGLIDSAYIQARQVDLQRDSAFVTGIIDSAYINARVSAGTDSSTVVSLITSNVDSAYVQARQSTVSGGATTITTFNFEADSGQTTFSGADIDGSSLTYTAGKLNVYLNGILLVDSNDYTATNGTSVVLTTGADSSDIVSVISYITQSVGTLDSAGVTNLIDSAYIQARQVDLQRDSAFVTGIIDAAYIQANQTTYDFLDSTEALNLIAAAGYTTFDSTNATGLITSYGYSTYDSGNFTGQLTNSVLRGLIDDSSLTIDGDGSTGGVKIEDGGITIRTGTGNVAYADFYCEVTNAHRTRVKSADHASYSGNVDVTLPTSTGTLALTSDIPTAVSSLTNDANYLDSTTVTGVIDATYIQANQTTFLDSALTIQLIDSAYVQARQTAGGGGGTDSATVISLIGTTVDSAYIQARQTATGNYAAATTIKQYDYEADSAQTTFGGADIDGQTLAYTAGKLAVYLNGILLVDSNDYTATNGTNVVFASGLDSGDTVSVISYITELDNLDSGVAAIVDSAYVQARVGTGSVTLAYDANLQGFVDALTLPTSDGTINQVLVTNGSGTISFADQSGGLDSALITQLIDSAYVQAREGAGGAGGGLDSAATNTLIDAKLQVLDVSDVVGADGNAGQLLKSLGNGEAEWTDLKIPDFKPSSSTASGNKGEITYDSAHLYICVATNSWRRIIWTDSSW